MLFFCLYKGVGLAHHAFERSNARLARTNRSLAEKILDRIKQFLQVFTAKPPEEKAEVRRLQEAERLYLNAIDELGGTYRDGKIHLANREDDEKAHVAAESTQISAENGAESVDESGELRYNKRELYTSTGAFHKEVVAEDQHALHAVWQTKLRDLQRGK